MPSNSTWHRSSTLPPWRPILPSSYCCSSVSIFPSRNSLPPACSSSSSWGSLSFETRGFPPGTAWGWTMHWNTDLSSWTPSPQRSNPYSSNSPARRCSTWAYWWRLSSQSETFRRRSRRILDQGSVGIMQNRMHSWGCPYSWDRPHLPRGQSTGKSWK